MNTFGSQGKLVIAFARLVREMWVGDLPYLTPFEFRVSNLLVAARSPNSFYTIAEIDMPTQERIHRERSTRLAGVPYLLARWSP